MILYTKIYCGIIYFSSKFTDFLGTPHQKNYSSYKSIGHIVYSLIMINSSKLSISELCSNATIFHR